jgi:sulfate adenylyltransferase subunit 1 (EFTu-like GTPase family)
MGTAEMRTRVSEPPVDRVHLAGIVNLGAVKVGDSLIVLCQGGGVAVVLEDIVTLDRGRLQEASKGQEVSLTVRGICKEQPAPGDCVVASHA